MKILVVQLSRMIVIWICTKEVPYHAYSRAMWCDATYQYLWLIQRKSFHLLLRVSHEFQDFETELSDDQFFLSTEREHLLERGAFTNFLKCPLIFFLHAAREMHLKHCHDTRCWFMIFLPFYLLEITACADIKNQMECNRRQWQMSIFESTCVLVKILVLASKFKENPLKQRDLQVLTFCWFWGDTLSVKHSPLDAQVMRQIITM